MSQLLVFLSLFALGYACRDSRSTAQASSEPPVFKDTTNVQIDFVKDIQPLLKANCTPCHFPGGKMYARMPFDNPQTIRDHSAGIVRRFKNPEEVKKLRDFIGGS